MSKKHFNIVERLAAKNVKPTLQITEDLKVTVNTSIAAGLALQEFQKMEKDNIEQIEKLLNVLVGATATQKILELDLTVDAFEVLIDGIMSAFNGEEVETPSESAQ